MKSISNFGKNRCSITNQTKIVQKALEVGARVADKKEQTSIPFLLNLQVKFLMLCFQKKN